MENRVIFFFPGKGAILPRKVDIWGGETHITPFFTPSAEHDDIGGCQLGVREGLQAVWLLLLVRPYGQEASEAALGRSGAMCPDGMGRRSIDVRSLVDCRPIESL